MPRSARPIQNPAAWVTADDYPAGALRDGVEGTVQIRFRIDRQGRIVDCVTAQTSGSPLLDATACGLVEERGRYLPARDAANRAVPETRTLRFRWRIPD